MGLFYLSRSKAGFLAKSGFLKLIGFLLGAWLAFNSLVECQLGSLRHDAHNALDPVKTFLKSLLKN
jgi:hypothetical protein